MRAPDLISRRRFLRSGSAALCGFALPAVGRDQGRRPRVGIIGGGLAGVTAAWLLDGVADAVLFEARPRLGGHAESIPITVRDQTIYVDIGAQFFSDRAHPTYANLMRQVGLLQPADPEADATYTADMTITVFRNRHATPIFLSPSTDRWWPLLARWNWRPLWAFLLFTLDAQTLVEEGDWLLTVDDWLAGLPVDRDQRANLLLPMISAMVGCTIEQARGLSARNAVQFVGKAVPPNLLDPVRYNNSLLGLGGNVHAIAAQSPNLTVHLNAPVRRISFAPGGGHILETNRGIREQVDALIIAAPPRGARPLLAGLPGWAGVARALGRLPFFPSELALHADATLVPRSSWNRSAYNARVDPDRCEASVWYNALHPALSTSAGPQFYKSWITGRGAELRGQAYRRAFLHPLVTPDYIRILRTLASVQGHDAIWLAGSYTMEVDSQETAVLSAVRTVSALAPHAPNLARLRGRAAPRVSGCPQSSDCCG